LSGVIALEPKGPHRPCRSEHVCSWPDPDGPIGVRRLRWSGTTGRAHDTRETTLMTRSEPLGKLRALAPQLFGRHWTVRSDPRERPAALAAHSACHEVRSAEAPRHAVVADHPGRPDRGNAMARRALPRLRHQPRNRSHDRRPHLIAPVDTLVVGLRCSWCPAPRQCRRSMDCMRCRPAKIAASTL
jgi:hypothetical protein